ncbi:MAG: YggT family protein [Treponema sp.]|jgi:YggT family protein|nr:YggT family protein [Treponema sp.]
MSFILTLLGNLAGLYMLLIFIRVMLSWFGGARLGRPAEILAQLTDPYLNWWRRFPIFRTGYIDLSPVAGLTALSLVQTVCNTTVYYGRLSLGILLTIVLQAAWSIVSFALGFFIIVLLLRLIAYLTNRNIYSTFWRIVDSISQPVLYRITRIFFRRRLINYLAGIVLSAGVLTVLGIGGHLLVTLLSGIFQGLPF